MTRGARFDVLLVLAAAPAAVFLGKPLWQDSAVYSSVFTPGVLIWVGVLSKLALLAVGVALGYGSARRFERGNPIRPAWMLLATGLLAFLLGQLSLAPYQLFLNTPVPFPSVADVFFLIAYPFLTVAVAAFVSGYGKAGFPLGSAGERWGIAVVVVLVCAALGYAVLAPIVRAEIPPIEKVLNTTYPVLDFILLIPTFVLLRITLRMRGGQVGRIWLMLLAGFVFVCVGDTLFAYLSSLGFAQLDPVVDALYILAYAFLARGTVRQHELLTS